MRWMLFAKYLGFKNSLLINIVGDNRKPWQMKSAWLPLLAKPTSHAPKVLIIFTEITA